MRIVSLLSSATEMLFALGLGERVLAVSHECDYPPEARKRPRATRSQVDSSAGSRAIDEQVKSLAAGGGALYDIDRGLLRELRPDLIVTQAQCDVCAVRYEDVVDFVNAEPALRQTQVLALNPSSLGDVLNDLKRIGEACGLRDAAKRYVTQLESRIRAVAARTGRSGLPSRTLPSDAESTRKSGPSRQEGPTVAGPTVVVIEWIEPLMTAGNWTPELVALAGGRELLAEPGRHSGYVEWNDVVSADPDVLIISPCGFDLARTLVEVEVLRRRPEWPQLKAVRSERTFAIDGNAYLNRSGPRLVDSLELLARFIHPDASASVPSTLAEGHAWSRLR